LSPPQVLAIRWVTFDTMSRRTLPPMLWINVISRFCNNSRAVTVEANPASHTHFLHHRSEFIRPINYTNRSCHQMEHFFLLSTHATPTTQLVTELICIHISHPTKTQQHIQYAKLN
jgi:hypothetical protein